MRSRAGQHEQMLVSPQVSHMLARRVRLPNCTTDQNYYLAQRTEAHGPQNTLLTTNTTHFSRKTIFKFIREVIS